MTGLHTLAPTIAGGAINSLLVGLAMALLSQFLLWFVARRHAGVRFALLYSALIGVVAAFLWRTGNREVVSYSSGTEIALPSRWAFYLVCAWAAMAVIGLMRIGAGLCQLRALRRSFVPLDNAAASQLMQGRSGRQVGLFTSEYVRVPTALGFFRPAVVVPKWAVSELSNQELKITLLHELAHVDRWDDWTNLAQKIIRALLFFHPAVWWIDSRLGIEREMSCDDAVLAQSASPQSYAECLVSIAEKTFLQKQLSLAHAAVGQVKQTASRIQKILDGRKREAVSAWKPAMAALTAFSLLSAVAVEHTPQLIGFKDAPAATNSASFEEPIQSYHPRVVPAAMISAPATKKSGLRLAATSRPRFEKASRKPDFQNFVAHESEVLAPRVKPVNASATQEAPRFMFVVLQTREYDGTTMTVTTTVWRMKVGKNAPGQPTPSAIPHST